MIQHATIPEAFRDLFDEPALGNISYVNDHGQIVTFPMWVDLDGERLLASSVVGSLKGRSLRARPQVSVSIVSTTTPFRWLSVSGQVVEIRPDVGLEMIDRMSRKYLGVGYQQRTPREIFVIAVDRVSHMASWG